MAQRRIYGINEIAVALGVRRETVAQWHNRKQLPEPDEHLAMGPAWLAETIRPWMENKRAQLAAKALMSTNLGMILWFLFLAGLVWANVTARREFDDACVFGSPDAIERATCRYGNVPHAADHFEKLTLGLVDD
ncbi:MAG TPA: hypothetical protein VG318_14185 [Actinomycetota bacterium]|nr:hypothetical protein [Actinomycetota bacterium]